MLRTKTTLLVALIERKRSKVHSTPHTEEIGELTERKSLYEDARNVFSKGDEEVTICRAQLECSLQRQELHYFFQISHYHNIYSRVVLSQAKSSFVRLYPSVS